MMTLEDVALNPAKPLYPDPSTNLHMALSRTGFHAQPTNQSFIMRYCVIFSAPPPPPEYRNIANDWCFQHNVSALIRATCNLRNRFQLLRGAPGHGSSLCTEFWGISHWACFAQTLPASGGVVNTQKAWFSGPAVGSKLNFL